VTLADAPIEGLTFDFWNTLIAEGAEGAADHRLERWSAALGDAGHVVDQVDIERAMTDLWSWFNGEWEANRLVTPPRAVDQMIALLAVVPSDALVAEMVTTLEQGWEPAVMTTAPGLGDALESLRSAGVRLGIICDVGFTPSSTLRGYLDHHGLLGHFDGWSFSDEVGCYKPDPAIYAHARSALGVAGPMAHVGDLRRTDIAGANGAGWTSIRYAGFYDDQSDRPEADHVVTAHADLLSILRP
jgi:FMN phosphatase YigB (HAD superfamily)